MKERRLENIQIFTLIVSAVASFQMLTFESDLASTARQDAWITMLLSGIVVILVSLIIYFLSSLYPDNDLPEIFLAVGGKVLGRIIFIPILLNILVRMGLALSFFSQSIKTVLLDETPGIVISFIMILVVFLCVKRGIFSIGAVVDVLFPFFSIPFIVLILLSLKEADFSHIKPILYHNAGDVLKAVPSGFSAYAGYSLFAYFMCYTVEPKKTIKWYMGALALTITGYVALMLSTLFVFGAEEIQTMVYPTIDLAKAIEFPATLMERLETLIFLVWIGALFAAFILFGFASVRNFSVMLGLNKKYEKYIAYAHIPIILFLSTISQNTIQDFTLDGYLGQFEFYMTIILLPIFTGVAWIRSKRKNTGRG